MGHFTEKIIEDSIISILQRDGPLRCTIVGAKLREMLDPSVTTYIKKLKGLKKFIEMRPKIFCIIQKDQIVSLVSKIEKRNLIERNLSSLLASNTDLVDHYVKGIANDINQKNYSNLASQFQIWNRSMVFEIGKWMVDRNITNEQDITRHSYLKDIPNFYYSLVLNQLLVFVSLVNDQQSSFNKIEEQISNFWPVCDFQNLFVLGIICANYRILASNLDRKISIDDNTLTRSASVFIRSLLTRDRDEDRPTAVVAVSVLLRLAFIARNIGSVRALNNSITPFRHPPSPAPHCVVSYFFLARYNIYEGNYKLANENFSEAYRICQKSHVQNLRVIFKYWFVVAAVHGKFPTDELLRKYDLEEFILFYDAMKKGNLKLFREFVFPEGFKENFPLLLVELNLVVYRNLLKKTLKILGNTTRMKLLNFQKVLCFNDFNVDMEECQAIAATLISKNFVKGYISAQHQAIVFSKSEQFPDPTKWIIGH